MPEMKGEEIFHVGTWNGIEFKEADVDALVNSFVALSLGRRVPLKFGHTKEEGMPAIGWVSRIWREGHKLLADFTDVPQVVFDAVKKGLYKFVSIEALRDVKAGTRTIPWVLDAVALLGADPPAVGDLKALQALTMTRSHALRGRERVAFRRDQKSEDNTMSVTPEEMNRKLAEQQANFDREKAANAMLLANEKAERLKDRAASRRDLIKLRFDRKVEDKKLLPRSFEKFSALYRLADDAACVDIKDTDVESFMAEREEVDLPEIKKQNKGGAKKGDDEAAETGTFVEVVQMRAQKVCVERGGKVTNSDDMRDATKIVFQRDPALGKGYFENPDAPYTKKEDDDK